MGNFLIIKTGRQYAITRNHGTLEVKVRQELENGLLHLVVYSSDAKNKAKEKRNKAMVLYYFNPKDGTSKAFDSYYGNNCVRNAISCLKRFNKLLARF